MSLSSTNMKEEGRERERKKKTHCNANSEGTSHDQSSATSTPRAPIFSISSVNTPGSDSTAWKRKIAVKTLHRDEAKVCSMGTGRRVGERRRSEGKRDNAYRATYSLSRNPMFPW